MKRLIRLGAIGGAAIVLAAGAATQVDLAAEVKPVESPTPPGVSHRSPVPPAERRAFFGELHLHTAMSLDAWAFGTKVSPEIAYRFARGETVMVPAIQVEVQQGLATTGEVPAKRSWPLDFAAVTDHAEYMGAFTELDDLGSAFARTDTGQRLKAAGEGAFPLSQAIVRGPPGPAANDLRAAAASSDAWGRQIRAANDAYRPGSFTTFVGYEWTGSPGGDVHMHRNVFFNGATAPPPFTALQSNKPEDLWAYLASVRRRGTDALAIPHNSNLSDGRDFDWNMSDGRPIDAVYALQRSLNEPLVEIAQSKGASETTPQLSPADEFAGFEIRDFVARGETVPRQAGSYVRDAWGRGLVIQSRVGENPFKMGVVGASDLHNGLSVSEEAGFAGRISGIDPKTMLPTERIARASLNLPGGVPGAGGRAPLEFGSAAITGVWAEENSRNAIFAAMKRRETFATSGTRIRLRMFGGWMFEPGLTRQRDWVARAYASGVPMGGDLPARPAGATAPRFVVQAMKDPDAANLDRVQIVKVWLKPDGTYGEKVFDVALSGGRKPNAAGRVPPVGDTVDLKAGTYRNTIGAAILTTVWRDPAFDPRTPATYYARALEIPTPRWTTLLAVRRKLPLPAGSPATLQERAWSSPIWYTPAT